MCVIPWMYICQWMGVTNSVPCFPEEALEAGPMSFDELKLTKIAKSAGGVAFCTRLGLTAK